MSQRHIIPVEKSNIVKSLRRLKSKACDLDSICAAHLDPRSTELVSHLQLLIQRCLSRSIVPDSFLCGSVTSILKKGKDLHSCNSYRPITVACTLSKLFEYVLLPHIDEFANYEANQFGFRSGLSCQHAHRVLAQLIKEATRNSYSLHFCTLDISKAFDSICHAQAFYALSQLGVNASVILVLKFWYSNSYLRLKSGSGDFSDVCQLSLELGRGEFSLPISLALLLNMFCLVYVVLALRDSQTCHT